MPCLIDARGPAPTIGDPLVDEYLRFTAARVRPNKLVAQAYDLRVFFTAVPKPAVQVTTSDVLAFIEAQRAPRRGGSRPSLAKATNSLSDTRLQKWSELHLMCQLSPPPLLARAPEAGPPGRAAIVR